MFIIAFAPEDGTGDESLCHLGAMNTGHYPRETKVLPRSKAATFSEAHLTISSHLVETPNEDPSSFSGCLDVLGLDNRHNYLVIKRAELGQHNFIKDPPKNEEPTATFTVGYHSRRNWRGNPGERYGDPHAIYNPYVDRVQLCGFLAISQQIAHHHDVLKLLGTKDPAFYVSKTNWDWEQEHIT
jgi:hypothetical protein